MRAATDRVAMTCLSGGAGGQSAPDRLTQAEAMMATGLAAMREVRSPFDAFYDGLDDEQRRKLDRMLDHRA